MGNITKLLSTIKHRPIPFLVIIYILVRFPNLISIPIFNDEAIYLDWGWRMTHVPGHLYYSLYDAKQPFVMWLFGISSSIFSDPLFAGRLISFILGLFSTIGLYFIGKEYYSRKFGVITSIAYVSIPIFVLFDRQALLESALVVTNIWGFYFVKRSIEKLRLVKHELLTGLILGLGFLSKITTLLFLVSTIVLFTVRYFATKNSTYIKRLLLILLTFFAVIFILLINQQFWTTLSSNSRYVLTIGEVFRLPIQIWIINIIAITTIGVLFVTPLIFFFSTTQLFKYAYRRTNLELVIWIVIPLFITTLTLKSPTQRYIVCLLPLLTVLFAGFVSEIKHNIIKTILLLLSIGIALFTSLFQIYKPIEYFQVSNSITTLGEYVIVSGPTSGYGFQEVIEFLEIENKKNPIVVTYAENTGNPESGLSVYLNKKKIMNGYMEARYLEGLSPEIQCIQLQSGQTMYFVSRDEQLAGLEKYVEKVKTFIKPLSHDTLGVYIFKKGCEVSITVNPVVVNNK